MPAPTTAKIIIVTGANRGIGHAICTRLLQTDPNITLIPTTRAGGQDLNLGGRRAKRLDISQSESIASFAAEVRREFGRVDVLVNNAGVNLDAEYGVESARRTLGVNYFGTLEMCQSLLPLLPKNQAGGQEEEAGRIVNLSSIASSLHPYPAHTQQTLRNPHLTLPEISTQIIDKYLASIPTNTEAEAGFFGPGRAYSISKACVNALTRVLARENPGVLVNCCCPGWVATEMGLLVGARAPKTVEEGARIPVRLAVGDIGGVSGGFWANASVRGKGEGEVREW